MCGALRRGLFWLLCFSLAAGPALGCYAQPASSGISQTDLKLRLLKLEAKLQILEKAWSEQTISFQRAKALSLELQNELDELRRSLASSQASLTSSRAELAQSQNFSATLQQRLDNLSTTFDEYQRSARWKILLAGLAGFLFGAEAGATTVTFFK